MANGYLEIKKEQLPQAELYTPHFATHFLTNNRDLGFTALSGFDDIQSDDGRTIEEVKADVYADLKSFTSLEQKVKEQFIDQSGTGQYLP